MSYEIIIKVTYFIVALVLLKIAIHFLMSGIHVLRDPAYDQKRKIAQAIARYKKGEITAEELESQCPEGSLNYGIVFDIKTGQLIRAVRMADNW